MPRNYNLYLRGSVGGWDFDADYVNWVLDQNKDKQVNVLIDSRGGRVDTALSISALFKAHGNVHCHYVAMNASAATIASMGAKHVTIDEGAVYLVHKCMNLVLEWDYMNADELEAHIAQLQKMKEDQDVIDGCIAGMYAKRCKKTKDELLALMKKGGWLTPQQALEWGFVDEITSYEDDRKPELTESVANELASAGIPLPPIDLKKDSFLARLKKLFAPDSFQSASTDCGSPAVHDCGANEVSASDKPQPKTDNQNTMAKALSAIAALLGASLAITDGKLSLSEEQAGKIEDTLTEKDNTINELTQKLAEKDTQINDLNKKVEDLRKEPADTTDNVTEQKSDDKKSGPGENIDQLVDELAKAYCS